MKKENTLTWLSAEGKEIIVKITVVRAMETETVYADGWNVELSKKQVVESLELEIHVAGKFIGRTSEKPSVVVAPLYMQKTIDLVKSQGGYAILAQKLILKEDRYSEIMTAIDQLVMDASQDTEYAKYQGIEIVKVKAGQIVEAKKVISESQTRKTEILTDAEEKQWRINYNDINNEGGEGYVPHRITAERVEWAMTILK